MLNFDKKIYDTSHLPINDDLEKFSPSFVSEKFTSEEKRFLGPFFSNIDKPVFVAKHLPEEVIGALSSRYSRSTKSLRRMFLDEYIAPIIKPEEQKDWAEITASEKKKRFETKNKLLELIEFMHNHGGIDVVTNVQRARKFFDKWLAEYGDDSIAELGTVHICLEGISNVGSQEIMEKRIGVSFLEKSSRYVSFADPDFDGKFRYVIPGEIKKTRLEKEYISSMDLLFETYSGMAEPYFDYIGNLYPQGLDETPNSFKGSRSAKRYDDIRDLLPFSTKSNIAMSGNGRVYEDVVNRLLSHPLIEIRWFGQQIVKEISQVVPSFVSRPQTGRGAELQLYRANIRKLREIQAGRELKKKPIGKMEHWVKLLRYDKDADVEILTDFLFSAAGGYSLSEIKNVVTRIGKKKREAMIEEIFKERKFGRSEYVRQYDRFRKVPRAFENANYLFEIWGRGGDYRDLHRHRMNTQEHQLYTTYWGYDLEKEVINSKFSSQFKKAMQISDSMFKKLAKVSPQVAQYAVCYGFIQHWYMNLTAREIYWMIELRTGSQGRPFYRKICQQIAAKAKEASPSVFSGLLVDNDDYALSRRESEKKIEAKKRSLNA